MSTLVDLEQAKGQAKLWLIAQNAAETVKVSLFESQMLYFKRTGTVDVNAIN